MAEFLQGFCNIFGAESGGGRLLGGQSDAKPAVQWYCDKRPVGRFVMECGHGHKGQMMELCQRHYDQFKGGKVQYCPRCNQEPPGHRCTLSIKHK